MTKIELIKETALRTGSSAADVQRIIDSAFDVIENECASGGIVKIRGFGTFGVKVRNPRRVYNPKKKCAETVPLTCTPELKPAKEFKEKVSKKQHSADKK